MAPCVEELKLKGKIDSDKIIIIELTSGSKFCRFLVHNILRYFSSTQIGFNSAHNSFPHITLFSGMAVVDCEVETLLRSVKDVADNFAREFANHGHLKLEKYISPNFVALFVGKNEEILLRSFVQELSDSLSSRLGLKPNQGSDAGSTSNKSYHVTLAYQVWPTCSKFS